MNCYPSQDELNNPKVVKLAKGLVGKSQKETLTNILEWQHRNIAFWSERWLLSMAIWISLAIFAVALYIFSFILRFDVASGFFIIATFGVPLATSCVLMMVFVHFNSGLPMRETLRAVWVGCLPIEHILLNRLAVCKDYAKLTACLLSNATDDGKIYISSGSSHAAASILLNKKLYFLDQLLPIYCIGSVTNWKKLGFNNIVNLQDGKWQKVSITSVLTPNAEQIDNNHLVQLLAKRISQSLNVQTKVVDKEQPIISVKIKWKNGLLKYADEEVLNYSVARAISNKMLDNRLKPNQILIEMSIDQQNITFNFRNIEE